ncbi:MAG TPA: methyltransferase [Bryobacteraceae bacterium]|nr:methyltransferase [Bryobacteraceae bacterium]
MELWTLSDLATPWCVHVVATLRIAEHIQAGKQEIEELARAAGADCDALDRVMRHLVEKGVFEQPSRGRFALNDVARGLLEPGLQLGLDLEGFGGRMAHAWGTLLQAVRTGKPAYHEYFGREYWEDLEAHPEIAAEFDRMMGPEGHGTPDPEVLIDPAGWDSVRTVVDVGGGTGALLAEILRAHPEVRGVLVDLPRTVARSGAIFREAGVADRVKAVGQSFFDPLPPGADLYVLKSVLNDWPDREATAILKRCAEAARPSGRVVFFSGAGEGEEASPELLMLVLVGGKARTVEEFRKMTREAGLELKKVGRQKSGRVLIECRPA